jgi:hypothetical protein
LIEMKRIQDDNERRKNQPAKVLPFPGEDEREEREKTRSERRSLGQMIVESKAFKTFIKTTPAVRFASRTASIPSRRRRIHDERRLVAGVDARSRARDREGDATDSGPRHHPDGPDEAGGVVYMEETTRTHNAAERAENAAYAESPSRSRSGARRCADRRLRAGHGRAARGRGTGAVVPEHASRLRRQPAPRQPDRQRRRQRAEPDGHPEQVWHSDAGEGQRPCAGRLLQGDGERPRHGSRGAERPHHSPARLAGHSSPAHRRRHLHLGLAGGSRSGAHVGLERRAGRFDRPGHRHYRRLRDLHPALHRAGIEVAVGYNGTDFTNGRKTVRAGMRVALAIYRAAAFCTVTGL